MICSLSLLIVKNASSSDSQAAKPVSPSFFFIFLVMRERKMENSLGLLVFNGEEYSTV
jgi:hypothetical protein